MIIVLNGPINSGKSTVAKLLAKKIPKTAVVEVDVIREFLVMEGSEGWEISFRAAIELVEGFVREGVSVILVYHITKSDFENIEKRFSNVPVFGFTLKPTKETLLQNRGDRPLNEYLVSKIENTYDSEEYLGDYGVVIDNTNQTSEETVDFILKSIVL
jgi:AAA+ ATPase superfamily predicted ATPase